MRTRSEKTSATVTISLPGNYRRAGFLAFHQRDTERLAERTTTRSLEKGLLWQGYPALLRVVFHPGEARASLAVDRPHGGKGGCADGSHAAVPPDIQEQLRILVTRMTGLDQPVERFEADYSGHAVIGPLVSRGAGLRVPQTATPFEALCWAIIGQQVSVSAAVSIRRRFIQAAGLRHSSGLLCFPDSRTVAAMGEESLRGSGFSRTKALSVLELSAAVLAGHAPLEVWAGQLRGGDISADILRERLTAIKGIGPWTVSYALLRGFGWLDGSLHGDVAVRRNLARLLCREDKITEKETEAWLAEFSPWRALVGAHLWNMQSLDGF